MAADCKNQESYPSHESIERNIRTNYFPIYRAVTHFVPTIEEVIGGKILEDEIAFLVIHFSTIASVIKRDLNYVYKSVVVCNHGMATGNLLAESEKVSSDRDYCSFKFKRNRISR